MKKVILITMILVSGLSAKTACTMYLEYGLKNMELAAIQSVKSTRNLYIQFAIEADIEAKYVCTNKKVLKHLKQNIKFLKKELRK